MISTHRLLQLNGLLDTLDSRARVAMAAGVSSLKIGNLKAADFFFKKSIRINHARLACRSRIEEIRPSRVCEDNKTTRPVCQATCKWRIKANFNLQRNALRIETMVESNRCGWNIKPGVMGGHPLDYEPCFFAN